MGVKEWVINVPHGFMRCLEWDVIKISLVAFQLRFLYLVVQVMDVFTRVLPYDGLKLIE